MLLAGKALAALDKDIAETASHTLCHMCARSSLQTGKVGFASRSAMLMLRRLVMQKTFIRHDMAQLMRQKTLPSSSQVVQCRAYKNLTTIIINNKDANCMNHAG